LVKAAWSRRRARGSYPAHRHRELRGGGV